MDIGISNCNALQIAKASELVKEKEWEQFVSIQGHHRLLFCEEGKEMVPFCLEDNISMTPYLGEYTKRYDEDFMARAKYNRIMDNDQAIIERVEELAKKKGVTMSEITLAWLCYKKTVPAIGTTKKSHIESSGKSLKVELTPEEIHHLEELYTPHHLTGVIATNTQAKMHFLD